METSLIVSQVYSKQHESQQFITLFKAGSINTLCGVLVLLRSGLGQTTRMEEGIEAGWTYGCPAGTLKHHVWPRTYAK